MSGRGTKKSRRQHAGGRGNVGEAGFSNNERRPLTMPQSLRIVDAGSDEVLVARTLANFCALGKVENRCADL